MVKFQTISFEGIYHADLNLNKETLKRIIEIIYELENDPDKLYSGKGRTFILKNGFHSVNILDKKLGLMEKYKELNLMVSRIQEILFTEFNNHNFFCTLKEAPGEIYIQELWINILRIEDYNNPHTHPNNHLSGNFYLSIPENMGDTKGYSPGYLCWITDTPQMSCPFNKPRGLNLTKPCINKGVIFESHIKHQVLPHFTDEDRIGCAFNAIYKADYTYDDLYPVPYWLPLKYNKVIEEENIVDDNTYHLKFKNGIEIDIYFKNIRDFIGKDVYFNPYELQKHRDKYNIDYKKYFGYIIEKDDYFTSIEKKWNDNDLHYYENFDTDILLIIFSGKGGNNMRPTFIFNNFLSDYRMDKLFLRDLEFSWFLNNNNFNKNSDNPINGLLDLIKTYIKPRHKKIYTIGASAGGFAAILFGHLLNVTGCLSFAPQTLINQDKKLLLDDDRWEKHSEKVCKEVDSKYLDLNNFLPLNMKTKVFYTSDQDKKHIKNLNYDENIESVFIEDKNNLENHLTAKIMKNNGMLKTQLDQMIMNFYFNF